MNCYIIDDERHAIESLKSLILKTPGLELVGENTLPLEALQEISSGKIKVDLTFLDIEMQDISGDKLAPLLLPFTNIIFSTGSVDFAIEAFNLDVIDYLLKPIAYERFLKAISKAKEKLNQSATIAPAEPEYFYIQGELKGKYIKINKKEIVFIESSSHYIHIHLDHRKHITYSQLTEIEEALADPKFMRVHKSFIVNLDKVSGVEGNMIQLTNGKSITIGPNYRGAFFEKINPVLLKGRK